MLFLFFYKQKTAYEMRISDWSSDVCSSDLASAIFVPLYGHVVREGRVRNAGLVEHLNRHSRFGKTQRGTIEQRFLLGQIVHRELVQMVKNFIQAQIGRASCRERVCKYG